MELSARNQPRGTLRDIQLGTIMAEVVAAVTRSSVERMGLTVGTAALAVIKAPEVITANP